MSKLWGGRFSQSIDPILEKFNSSIKFDKKLWKADIQGSKGYAISLNKIGILSSKEHSDIQKGLDQIYNLWLENKFIILETDEDIHTANERKLKELIGDAAGKLHTGRSRNDQVSTDFRLWARKDMYPEMRDTLSLLLKILVARSKEYICYRSPSNQASGGGKGEGHVFIFPGYTHLQRAQPVAFSHWLLSHAWALKRDYCKLINMAQLEEYGLNALTLGSGAIAGNPLAGFDREALAADLGFDYVSQNSIDATSDRDFVADILQWSTLVGIHLSKLAEDMILYSTKEFGFIRLSDAYTTGSSLMPQKKNPDSLELVRGKSGRVIGNLTGFLSVMKALPSSYNKDLQEDKEALFDSIDTVSAMIKIMSGVVATFQVNAEKLEAALTPDMLATDVAYYLVKKGMPFRDAHHVSGRVVSFAEQVGTTINNLSLDQLRAISELFDEDIQGIWNYSKSIEQYSCTGGTSPQSVGKQIELLQNFLDVKMQ